MANSLEQYVRQLKTGDIEAFDSIYELTHRKVFFVVYGILHDRQLTEDILQDTYMKLLSCIQQYKERNFLAYLLTMAKNLAINEYHRRKRTILSEEDLDVKVPMDLSDLLIIDAEKKELIEQALSVLNETERLIFLLHTLENMTHREISTIVDKPLGTITWTYQRALSKIRQAIKEGYDETT